MSLAMARLKNIGWMALVFFVAILLYPLSLRVAEEHSDLVRVERQIRAAKKEISFLDAEVRVRSSPGQLNQWNQVLYGYQAPTAGQYVTSDRALAALGGVTLPPIRPVLVSASATLGGVAPSGSVGPTEMAAAIDPAGSSVPPHGDRIADLERQLTADATLRDLRQREQDGGALR